MAAPTAFSLSTCVALLLLLPVYEAQTGTSTYSWTSQIYSTTRRPNSNNCGQSTFSGSIGNITSPNYPNIYDNNQFCNYFIVAPSLSTINFTFNALSTESCCDWIELTCQSNSIRRPVRYAGSGYWSELSFKPCTRVLMRFYTDGSVTSNGFSVSYDIEPISCQGNCTPIAIGAGYNCTCDANQTDPFIAPPYDQCPDGCLLSSPRPDSSTYCVCSISPTTTTARPTPTVPTCSSGCFPYFDSFGYPVCYCNVTVPSTTPTTTTPLQCPFGCYVGQDSFGYPICHCEGTTRTTPCPFGCYNVTYYSVIDWYSYCECSTPQNTSPLTITCPFECSPDTDFWGTPYCRCNYSSTTGPTTYTWPTASTRPTTTTFRPTSSTPRPTGSSTSLPPCYSPCFYDYDINGRLYCSCSSSTPAYCNYPCYYGYNDFGNYVCLCPTTAGTTTATLPSVCNTRYSSSYGTVMSPNYPNPYPANINCTQFITIPLANAIQITFTDLNVYYSSSEYCYYDWVEIRGCDGSVRQYCASYSVLNIPIQFVCTVDYTVAVRFHSYYYYNSYRGFRLDYRSTFASLCNSTGGLVSLGNSGSIMSPNYPGSYPLVTDCYYLLQAASGQNIRIRVAFESLSMHNSSGCSTEYINLSCLDGSGTPWIVCGTGIPRPVTFSCDSIDIQFHSAIPPSGSDLTPRFFKLVYYGIEGGQPMSTVSGTSAASLPNRLGLIGSAGVGYIRLLLLVVLAVMMTGSSPV